MLKLIQLHEQKQVNSMETNATIESPYLSNDFIWNVRTGAKCNKFKREKCFS